MINVGYAQTMSRYNRWQNEGLIEILSDLPTADLTADRGAFFGSILATVNHILWGDRIWMSRIDRWTTPEGGIPESGALYPTFAAWRADRERADARLITWSDNLRPAALRGDLTWFSGSAGREVTKPMGSCVAHLFNHQTHHRGQLHAMLTPLGLRPQDTDLFLMPDSVW